MSKRQARGVVKGILTKRLNPGKPEIGSRGKIKAAAPLHQPKIKAIIDEHFNQRKQANLELHRRALKHVDPDSNRSLGAKYTLLRIILRHESGKTPHTVDELYQEVSTSSHVKKDVFRDKWLTPLFQVGLIQKLRLKNRTQLHFCPESVPSS